MGARTFVNAAGTVALVADRGGAGTGTDVLVGNGSGAPAAVVSVGVGGASGLARIDLGVGPRVSDDGATVAFLATRTNGSRGVFQFTLGGATLTTLVETGNGLFSDVADFSLAGNQFALLGTLTPTALDPDGTRGLFNGANPLLSRIVAEGDLLTVNGTPTAVAGLAFTGGDLSAGGQVIPHLGDYIYEYETGGYGPGPAIGRVHEPANEIISLPDHRPEITGNFIGNWAKSARFCRSKQETHEGERPGSSGRIRSFFPVGFQKE